MKVPWQAWYGDMEEDLSFPAGWQVTLASMADAPELGDRAVDHALRNPMGTPPLKELTKGVSKAAIVVEDITRPSPTAQILAKILAQLEDGGLDRERVRIIVGTGAHTTMHRSELLKKLGLGTS